MDETILIVDAEDTQRLMLEVQLGAAGYRVVQARRMRQAMDLARRVRPDAVLAAMALPDGDAPTLHARLRGATDVKPPPMLALTAQNDRGARLRALAAGIDDALSRPVDDRLLRARIDSLIRDRGAPAPLAGFAETGPQFGAARIHLLTAAPGTARRWRAALARHLPGLEIAAPRLPTAPRPGAVVIELRPADPLAGLQWVSSLRAAAGVPGATVIAVVPPGAARLAARALDRGAHDVALHGFDAAEVALRLRARLRQPPPGAAATPPVTANGGGRDGSSPR